MSVIKTTEKMRSAHLHSLQCSFKESATKKQHKFEKMDIKQMLKNNYPQMLQHI